MAVIVNGDGILTGISSLATALTDLTSGRGTVTGVATVGTLQLGAGVSISSPRTQTAAIFTNNTEFLTVDDGGRVGVGTITPNSDAHPENEKKINVGFITARSIAGDIDANTMVVAGVGTFSYSGTAQYGLDVYNPTSGGSGARIRAGDNDSQYALLVEKGTDGTNLFEVLAGGGGARLRSGDLSILDKISHYGETDTHIRFPANDTISLETCGFVFPFQYVINGTLVPASNKLYFPPLS